MRTKVAVALVVAISLLSQGCYSYTYRVKDGGPNGTLVPYDPNVPESKVRVSYLWGLISAETWDPEECAGKGPGIVDTSFVWYSTPLMIITLGIVVPAEITIYCRTDEADSGTFGG